MPLYDRRVVTQQGSAETECTDALLKRHRPAMTIQTDDYIFSGRSVGSSQKDLDRKPTQATIAESSSGSYHQFQHNHSIEHNDSGTLDMSAMGSHGPQGTYPQYPPEEQYYQDQHNGQYPPEEKYYQDQHNGQYYLDEGQYYPEGEHYHHGGEGYGPPYYQDDGQNYDDQQYYDDDINSRGPVYDEDPQGYHRGHHQFLEMETEPYPEDDEYHGDVQGGGEDYDDYTDPHPRSYEENHYPENQYAQDEYVYNHNMHQGGHRQGKVQQSQWDATSEAFNTVESRTVKSNLRGVEYLRDPYNNNYYGEAETAFDYSVSQNPDRAQPTRALLQRPAEAYYDGASTLASPVNEDDRSHDSDWREGFLRNESLLDSPLSQDHTTNTDSTGTRRPVSKFIKRANKKVGQYTSKVTYKEGEFRYDESRSGSRDGSKSSRRKSRKGKKEESATILDIMYNVGHDLILGPPKGKRKNDKRRKDPAAKIVDGFKEMFNCGPAEDDDDDDDDSY